MTLDARAAPARTPNFAPMLAGFFALAERRRSAPILKPDATPAAAPAPAEATRSAFASVAGAGDLGGSGGRLADEAARLTLIVEAPPPEVVDISTVCE